MLESPEIKPDFWIVCYLDGSEFIIYADELTAYRHAQQISAVVKPGYYGESLREHRN